MCTDQEILFLVQLPKAKIMCVCELIPVQRPPEGIHCLMLADGSVLQGPALPAFVTSCQLDSTAITKQNNDQCLIGAVELEVHYYRKHQDALDILSQRTSSPRTL